MKQNIELSTPVNTFMSEEKNRGRTECRKIEVYNCLSNIDKGWPKLARIVFVHRTGYRKDSGFYDEKHYFITSNPIDDAEFLAQKIREHWHIENRLHYVKDVNYKEDKNRIRNGSSAAILSIIQDISITLYRCNGFQSIKKGTILFTNKIKELYGLMTNNYINKT